MHTKNIPGGDGAGPMGAARRATLTTLSLCLGLAAPIAAQAQTYVAKLQSGPLAPSINGGVAGVTHLTMTLDSSTPFQSGFEGVWNGKFNFSDGANTLKSLVAQGFTTQDGFPVVELVINGSGKVTGWFFHTTMIKSKGSSVYEIIAEYDIGGSGHVGTCGVSLKVRSVERASSGDGLHGRVRP